jgi:site-specific recombinase XerC
LPLKKHEWNIQGDFFIPQKKVVEYKDEWTKPINRFLFARQINKLFNEGKKRGKHIRFSSFRASLVTNMFQNDETLDTIKEIIGHRNIKSTEATIRSKYTES